MLSVWEHNASQWGDDTNQFERIPFHETSITREFLSESDRRFFICGLKGIGKTLLLQKKSLKIRNEQPGLILLPATQPVEKLTPLVYSMSEQDTKDLSVQTGWFRLWLFVLTLSILKRIIEVGQLPAETLPRRVLRAFPQMVATISYHVDGILRLGPHDRRVLIEQELEPLLTLLRSLHNGVAVFVDAIDDCVYSHMGPDLERYEDRSKTHLGVLSAKVWGAAQVGFVRAAVALHEVNRHVKVFGALRREALDGDIVPDRQNLEAYLVNLEYTRDDLRGIFTTKLSALFKQSPEYFVKPASPNLVEAFFGYTTLTHPTVKSLSWQPLEEAVLDYIIRHSRGRPRELDLVGESLQYMPGHSRPPEEVRHRVREKSKKWFDWAKSEMIPYWQDEYSKVLNTLPSNVLPKTEVQRLLQNAALTRSHPNALNELFELGLIGCVVPGEHGELTQRFRQNDPELPVTGELFEASSHYVVHPCVNLATRALKSTYEPDLHNVAGHGYGFVPGMRRFHVHFGLGNLGAGLVLPIVATSQGTSVAIIQRKSPRWAGARKWAGKARFAYRARVKDEGVTVPQASLYVRALVGSPNSATLDELLDWWRSGHGHICLVTNQVAAIRKVLEISTSVSMSLRSADSVVQVAKAIAKHGRGTVRAVYPFENDEKAIESLTGILTEARIPIVRVSADRICKDLTVVSTGAVVDTEDYYRVLVNDVSVESRAIFSGGDRDERHSVVFEGDQRRFLWGAEAKRLLVNGGHFAYVIYAFRWVNHLFPDRKDLVRMLLENPMSEVLFSQEVEDALNQVAALYVIYLLVVAEEKGLVASVEDVEGLFRHLKELQDTFSERLARTRDQIHRILKPTAKAIAERVERFHRPLRNLETRLRAATRTWEFYSANGLDLARVQQDSQGFSAACIELLDYIAQSESPD
jgi:hypothetical protein